MYYNYKQARDMVWRILLQENISELPVKISTLCNHVGASIVNYDTGHQMLQKLGLLEHSRKTDSFTLSVDGRYIILYNPTCSTPRIRFTLAHELGHIKLGHIIHLGNRITLINREPACNDNPIEQSANVFASRLLAPACVWWKLGASTADEIMTLCDISRPAAEFRAKRLRALYKREEQFRAERGHGCFLLSPLERQVYAQFKPYITAKLKVKIV